MLNIGLCDDEAPELEKLRGLIAAYARRRHLSFRIQAFQNGEDLLVAIRTGEVFDVIFLDVYMGLTNGLDIARKIRDFDGNCCLIFATNSRGHAIDGYGVHALEYLLKPIVEAEVWAALDVALEDLSRRKEGCLQFSNKQGSYKIPYGEIVYMESNARIVTIHSQRQGDLSFYSRLDDLEGQCEDPRFLRCHKSFIVNLDYAHAILGRSIVLESGQEIRISINLSEAKEIFASYAARKL